MTTDITELAQSLKAAANTTADAIDRLKAFPGDELIDLSQHEGEQVDIDITTLNEWYELSSPANILALVEALEKAQQQTTESENRVRKQNRHICELFDDNTALRQRIAELESRTVKLPKPISVLHRREFTAAHCAIYAYPEAEVNAALAAAGIKVEAE